VAVLVLCLGNPLRRDDGVGWRVADLLLAAPPAGAQIRKSSLSGLHLLDDMEGFERVVILDAVKTGRAAPGAVASFPLDAVRAAAGPTSHGLGLPSSLRLARAFGAEVPARLHVVAVEVEDMATVAEGLTAAVEAAIAPAAEAVREAVALLRA
jgi:hydrogenase maturation protease